MPYSILIIDDSLPMRTVIKRTLKTAGYGKGDLLEAANGQEAIDVLKNNWVDIVMTDYNMPVMDGLEFIKTIKKDDISKDIPVVVISTEGNKSKIKEFMDCGAAGYITKPFTAEVVRDLIINILGETDYEEDFNDSDEGFDF